MSSIANQCNVDEWGSLITSGTSPRMTNGEVGTLYTATRKCRIVIQGYSRVNVCEKRFKVNGTASASSYDFYTEDYQNSCSYTALANINVINNYNYQLRDKNDYKGYFVCTLDLKKGDYISEYIYRKFTDATYKTKFYVYELNN